MSSVILPGSYDPVTLGHLDIIKRASEMYDEVYVVAFINPEKNYMFTVEERVKMLILATDELDNVMVSYSLGRVVDYMVDHEIDKIIKGYRNEADLEYEKKQAEYNLAHGGFETEFWRSGDEFECISSTKARELLRTGADLSGVLPEKVIEYIKSRA